MATETMINTYGGQALQDYLDSKDTKDVVTQITLDASSLNDMEGQPERAAKLERLQDQGDAGDTLTLVSVSLEEEEKKSEGWLAGFLGAFR